MRFQRKLSNGMWHDDDRIDEFVDGALAREAWFAPRIKREPMTTRQQVLDYLATGKALRHDDDWYAEIRDADAQVAPTQKPAPKMVRCACGHTVEANLVMNASRGTSCPDCYDRMSE